MFVKCFFKLLLNRTLLFSSRNLELAMRVHKRCLPLIENIIGELIIRRANPSGDLINIIVFSKWLSVLKKTVILLGIVKE